METIQFLSVPENRTAVRAISQQVLAEVAPAEISVSARFIDPLIEMAPEGKVVADASDQAMGLAGGELMVLIVVPVVTTVLSKLLTKIGEDSIEALKKRLKHDQKAKALIKVTVDDIEVVVSRSKSPISKKKVRELVRVLNAALLSYLAS